MEVERVNHVFGGLFVLLFSWETDMFNFRYVNLECMFKENFLVRSGRFRTGV